MKTDKEVVMYDSEKAASRKTVTGWVSRTGRFWGEDEHMARFDGSTHAVCKCGEVVANHTYCTKCRDRIQHEKYLAMPVVAWDGVTPLNLHDTDNYFFDSESLLDHCAGERCQPQDLPLVLCVPTYAKGIDANEHYADDLPEDGEVPAQLAEAFRILNAAIEACKEPLCWTPGKTAVTPESLPTLDAEADEPVPASGAPLVALNAAGGPAVAVQAVDDLVILVVAQQLGWHPKEVRRDSLIFDDLLADSLDAAELLIALDEQFECEIPDAATAGVKTVADVIAVVKRYANLPA